MAVLRRARAPLVRRLPLPVGEARRPRRPPPPPIPGDDPYLKAVVAARKRWNRTLKRTVQDVRNAYSFTSQRLRAYARGMPAGTPAAQAAERLSSLLNAAIGDVNQETLRAVTNGVRLSIREGTWPGQQASAVTWGQISGWRDVVDLPGLDRAYRTINDRATLAHMTRVGPGGLTVSERIWAPQPFTGTATLERNLREMIVGGVDPRQAAREVAGLLQPGARTPHQLETARRLGVSPNLPYAALRITRTEMGQAFHEGTILGHANAPAYQGVVWRLSSSHPYRDVCDDLAEYTGYGGAGFYPAGKEPPKPHPQCLCVLLPDFEDLDAFTDKLIAWEDDPASQPALEDWYQQIGRTYLPRSATGTPPPTAGGGPRGVPPPEPAPEPLHADWSPEDFRQEVLRIDDEYAARARTLEAEKAEINAALDALRERRRREMRFYTEEEMAEADRLHDRLTAVMDRQGALATERRAVQREALYAYEANETHTALKLPLRMSPTIRKDPARRVPVEEAARHYERLLVQPQTLPTLGVETTRRARSFQDPTTGAIHLNGPARGRTAVHEVGHFLESQFADWPADRKAWVDWRAGDEPFQRFVDQPGGKGYSPDEVFRRDKFLVSYIGKDYAKYGGANWRSSETYAEGYALLWSEPGYVAREDPDMFRFLMAKARGLEYQGARDMAGPGMENAPPPTLAARPKSSGTPAP